MSRAATPEAFLVDFGGVLTTSVFDSFAAFCRTEQLPDDAIMECFKGDEIGTRLLVDVEEGRLSDADFERELAARLGTTAGRPIESEALLERINGGLRLEPLMVRATVAVRASGVTTVLVSNSLGMGSYTMVDLGELFDHVVLSGRVGVRKPSRRIYRIAAETAGAAPEACLMIDDLEHNLVGAGRIGMRTLLHRDPAESVAELERIFGVSVEAVA
jgi:putative hydrolase of the HAD superfamily